MHPHTPTYTPAPPTSYPNVSQTLAHTHILMHSHTLSHTYTCTHTYFIPHTSHTHFTCVHYHTHTHSHIIHVYSHTTHTLSPTHTHLTHICTFSLIHTHTHTHSQCFEEPWNSVLAVEQWCSSSQEGWIGWSVTVSVPAAARWRGPAVWGRGHGWAWHWVWSLGTSLDSSSAH